MKSKLFLLVLSVMGVLLTFTSCDKDDSFSKIVGTWQEVKNGNGTDSYVSFSANGEVFFYEIYSSEALVNKHYYALVQGTYMLSDNLLTMNLKGTTFSIIVNFNGDEMTTTSSQNGNSGTGTYRKVAMPLSDSEFYKLFGVYFNENSSASTKKGKLEGAWICDDVASFQVYREYMIFSGSSVCYHLITDGKARLCKKTKYTYSGSTLKISGGGLDATYSVSLSKDKLRLNNGGDITTYSKTLSPYSNSQLEKICK